MRLILIIVKRKELAVMMIVMIMKTCEGCKVILKSVVIKVVVMVLIVIVVNRKVLAMSMIVMIMKTCKGCKGQIQVCSS